MQRWRRSSNKYSNRPLLLQSKINLGGLRASKNSNRIRISSNKQLVRWPKFSKTNLFRKVGATEVQDHRVITTQPLSINSTEIAIKTQFSNSKKPRESFLRFLVWSVIGLSWLLQRNIWGPNLWWIQLNRELLKFEICLGRLQQLRS